MPTYESELDLFVDYYKNGGSFARYARAMESAARAMLNRAVLISHLARAKALRQMLDDLPFTDDNYWALNDMLNSCFDAIGDDLMLLSAVEIHAKAQLLRKGYVIHRIKTAPFDRKQMSAPIHRRTIQTHIKRKRDVVFVKDTIGINTLLKPQYAKLYPYVDEIAMGLKGVRYRRNLVHFWMTYSWSVDEHLINLADVLNKKIPGQAPRRRLASL